MNPAVEIDELIAYRNGKAYFHPLFVASPAMQDMLPLFENTQQKLQDFGIYVYYMYNGSSPYRNTPEADRERLFYYDKLAAYPDWLKEVLKTDQAQEFILHYKESALTPGQRIHLKMMESIGRFIEELANAKGGDDTVKLVEKGKKLYETQKEVQKMVQEQGTRKIAKGYQPRRFEVRPAMAAT